MATEQDLKDAFAAFGEVSSASIIMDKFSGESRGFGFVEMPNKEEAEKAVFFEPNPVEHRRIGPDLPS